MRIFGLFQPVRTQRHSTIAIFGLLLRPAACPCIHEPQSFTPRPPACTEYSPPACVLQRIISALQPELGLFLDFLVQAVLSMLHAST